MAVVGSSCHRDAMQPADERVTQRSEILLIVWKDHREQRRQHETQRSVMTNIIVLLASGLVALAAHHGLDRTVLPIAIAVTVLGIYGFLVSLKYNETSSKRRRPIARTPPAPRQTRSRAEALRRTRAGADPKAKGLSHQWSVESQPHLDLP